MTSQMKLVSLQGNKLTPNQRVVMSAKRIWELCHYINSAALINGVHNQWKIYPEVPIYMDVEKLLSLLQDNNVEIFGKKARVDKIKWTPSEDYAVADLRINELFQKSFNIEYYES